MTRARRCGLVAAQPGNAACGVGDRRLDFGLAGERDLGLHLAGVRIEYVAVRPDVPLTCLPPMK